MGILTSRNPYARNQLCNRGYTRGSNQICTCIVPERNKICTWTAKTRAIPSLHRDTFAAKVPVPSTRYARMLRRVTKPPHINITGICRDLAIAR